jgi:hypothetical protein
MAALQLKSRMAAVGEDRTGFGLGLAIVKGISLPIAFSVAVRLLGT